MLLRRITEHVKAQNWTALALDFIIVAVGVFMGLQVQQIVNERDRKQSEKQYLQRVHDEVVQLIDERSLYDQSRPAISASLSEALEVINSSDENASLSREQCRNIAHSSFTTVPPSGLPSVTELISAGRFNQLASKDLREAILAFVQDVERARDFIAIISESNVELGRRYPKLIETYIEGSMDDIVDGIDLRADCNLANIRNDPAFLNDLNGNIYMYKIYADRGIRRVSQRLLDLHEMLDGQIGSQHLTGFNEAQ